MQFERLWAPWRLSYIQGEDRPPSAAKPLKFPPGADEGCFICRAVADDADRENLVVRRGKQTITILNRYPYNNGHLLVAPVAHKAGLDELSSAEHLEIMETATQMTSLLAQRIRAEGFNIGLNLGEVGGAGLPGHLHWHLVPRWSGDTNFMPTLAATRVIPQSLDTLWELLAEAPSEADAETDRP